jgi:RNA polymerase sigma factor (sigma-70 family)
MFRYSRGIGLDYDTAQDVIQESFVTAYARLGECRDPTRFRQWLMRIVRNRCLDHHRDIRRNTAPLEVLDGGAPASAGTVPVGSNAVAAQRELRLELVRAFDRISPILRDAFLLKFQGGYTYDEMADLAGASASAMKMRVRRARQELKAQLDRSETQPM